MRKREYLDCQVCGMKILQTEYANGHLTFYPSARSGRSPTTFHSSCYDKLNREEQARYNRLFSIEDVPVKFDEKEGLFVEVRP